MAHVAREERWGDRTSIEDRRDEILRTLGVVLRQRGFGSMKMQDIADQLQMTKGNLYYYFGSKQELLFHAHMKCMAVSLAALEGSEHDPSPPAERLHKLLRLHIAGMLDEASGAVLLTDLEGLSADQRRQYVAQRDRFEAGVRRILIEGTEGGTFRKSDPRVAAFAILGGINWMPKWFQPDGVWSAAETADRFALFFLHSVLA